MILSIERDQANCRSRHVAFRRVRLLYVDDSGAEATGWIVYGWIECTPAGWRDASLTLLELRKRLYRDYQVPPSQELHATKFVNGRHHISTTPMARPQWDALGRAVAVDCLSMLRDCPHIAVGVAYRRTHLRAKKFYVEKAETYAALVRHWDHNLAADDAFALITMDGDGSDSTYSNAHRGLDLGTRRIIEDPVFHDSARSQLIQMADLVAYSAYMYLRPHPGNVHAQQWYPDYLRSSDVHGGPVAL